MKSHGALGHFVLLSSGKDSSRINCGIVRDQGETLLVVTPITSGVENLPRVKIDAGEFGLTRIAKQAFRDRVLGGPSIQLSKDQWAALSKEVDRAQGIEYESATEGDEGRAVQGASSSSLDLRIQRLESMIENLAEKMVTPPKSTGATSSKQPLDTSIGLGTAKTRSHGMLDLLASNPMAQPIMQSPITAKRDGIPTQMGAGGANLWLESDEESSTSHESDSALDQLVAQKAGTNLDTLVQLEMLRILKDLRRDKKTGSTSDSSDNEGVEDLSRGPKGFRGLHGLRKKFRRRPKRIIHQYVRACKSALGIHSEQVPWQLKDMSRKLYRRFGKQRSLHRVHVMVSTALQLLLADQTAHAGAYLVQMLKTLHQVAIDNGSWESAELLMPLGEGLDFSEFGGTESEMVAVHGYRKAMKELRGQHQQRQQVSPLDEEPEENNEERVHLSAKQRKALARQNRQNQQTNQQPEKPG